MNDLDHQPFDYDAIDRACDGYPPNDDAPDGRTYSRPELAAALAELLRWVIHGSPPRRRCEALPAAPEGGLDGPEASGMVRWIRGDLMAKRTIAAAWMLDPSLFAGMSLAGIGALPAVNASRRALCFHAADFEATFGIRSRAQRTQTNREQLSESASRRWQRERDARAKLDASAPKSVGQN